MSHTLSRRLASVPTKWRGASVLHRSGVCMPVRTPPMMLRIGLLSAHDELRGVSGPALLSVRALSTSPPRAMPSKGKDVVTPEEPKQSLPTRVWNKVKEEALHYWHGTKLLGKEISISFRLLRRMILGYTLTRREHRQLRRTMGDLLRLIPFIPFVIIPAAELLLPVALKIFPNMLPSTFESKFAAEEKRRRLLKLRIEMAKFLQESIKAGGLQVSHTVRDSEAFQDFYHKVRIGQHPSKQEVIQVAKLFDDELALENLTRPQLVSISRYMQLSAFGTDNYLRFQIRHALSRIRQDDLVISNEGSDSMSYQELLAACQSRGVWSHDRTQEQLKEGLDVWIKLHIREHISGTLLILSRAFYFLGESEDPNATYQDMQIKALELTMSSLPESLLNEAELNFSKESATNKQRLEVLQEQEELIEDEAEQEEEEQAARDAAKSRKDSEATEASKIVPSTQKDADDARMTHEQLTELGEALSILSAKSSVLRERQDLQQLMNDLPPEEREDTVEGDDNMPRKKSLYRKIRSMLKRIDKQLEEFDKDVGGRMNLIEASSTGKISVSDLEQALRLIKHRPDEEVLHKLVDKLDVDLDGLVPLDDVLELASQEKGLETTHGGTVKDIQKESERLQSKKPRMSDIVEDA
ncbi:LETM1 domain-containing protein Ylh47 [Malassezia pachydermatis]|uniref:Mitochondrial proton/calcium exchanger protein n=1 Tax=Malassezia pachydermatis TaxID=77020 RepID=A0A0M9VPX0_9BASI|nr:letm1-domain-containing protein [Malassezia pachydermatis]KOS14919.1 letm1-domain-containing protein [Malassezia pachydermatis]